MAKRWSSEEIALLTELYNQNYTFAEIHKKAFQHRSLNSLILKREQLKLIRPKKIEINQSLHKGDMTFFYCWFAGFFLGDGSISKKTLKARIRLSSKSINLLIAIAKYFNFPLERVKTSPNGKVCYLNFSKSFVLKLQNDFALSEFKSFGVTTFPHFLETPYLKAFLLGVYYADGSARIQTKFRIQFLQSKLFLQDLLIWIQNQTNLFAHFSNENIHQIICKSENFDLYEINFSGRQGLTLLKWLAEPEIVKQIPAWEAKIKLPLAFEFDESKQPKKLISSKKSFLNSTKKVWTIEEIEKLKDLITNSTDLTDEKMGQILGRSAKSIRHKRTQLGLKINVMSRLKAKKPSWPYVLDEITLIEGYLTNTSVWDKNLLIEIKNQVNGLACNKQKNIIRSLESIRVYISNNFQHLKHNM
uniref:Putative site-specific DNA endonuclease n=1 Tax=Pleurastrum terricola TaxID=34116 RepID=A6YG78_PLETE|nr:putative site-specific DNA endonuclease [Pleurastrum terricola]ABO69357.1 putative site-specific DNA endonuclease [Pleurastrum terricola]